MATKAKKVNKNKIAPRRKPAARRKAKAARRPLGKRAALEAAALGGHLPPPPDFSAETHLYYRPKLAKLVALARAGNLAKLLNFQIKGNSTSPRAMARYRDLAVLALKSRGK